MRDAHRCPSRASASHLQRTQCKVCTARRWAPSQLRRWATGHGSQGTAQDTCPVGQQSAPSQLRRACDLACVVPAEQAHCGVVLCEAWHPTWRRSRRHRAQGRRRSLSPSVATRRWTRRLRRPRRRRVLRQRYSLRRGRARSPRCEVRRTLGAQVRARGAPSLLFSFEVRKLARGEVVPDMRACTMGGTSRHPWHPNETPQSSRLTTPPFPHASHHQRGKGAHPAGRGAPAA